MKNKLKKLEEKINENKLQQRIHKELMSFYEKRNVLLWRIAKQKYDKLVKSCEKLVENYNKLLQSNKLIYPQLQLDI